MYDLIVRNGTVIDGSGKPMFRADVGVKEENITAVGDLSGETAERIIDADGLYVTPGFVDVNNHSDTYWELFRNPGLPSMLCQGVTTIVGGNSGASLAPLLRSEDIRSIQKWTDVDKITFNWLSMEEFLRETEKKKLGVNFATLVGHGTIRRSILRSPTKEVEPSDIAGMRKLLDQALKEGGIGLSSGLKYTHARSAEEGELVDLLKLVAEADGVYATYVRDEGEDLVRAVEEAILVARQAEASLHISHLKAVGRQNWPLMEEALSMIKSAAQGGLDITFDVYPYTASGSVLYTFLPEWVTESGRAAMLHRLRDYKVRQAVIRDMKAGGNDYSQMIIFSSTLNKMTVRNTIDDLARMQGRSPEETVLDVLLASEGRAIVSLEVSSEKNIRKAIQNPFSIISSNGVGYGKGHEAQSGRVHPRNFGTFPKVFAEYVRKEKILSWEEAVHKMTGKPAAKFHLDGRGIIGAERSADIVVFDPEAIRDTATMDNPFQYPEGIRYVIVNGRVAVEDGAQNETRAGEVIRKKKRGFFSW
jgi:N-acyl-D-aspartate/D-glutamate deacylase